MIQLPKAGCVDQHNQRHEDGPRRGAQSGGNLQKSRLLNSIEHRQEGSQP